MSEVQRICPQCTAAGPLNARYCPACGYDFEGSLPAIQSNLPVVLTTAAVPVLVGAASIALRLGWRALQGRWAREAAKKAVDVAINKVQSTTPHPDSAPTVRQQTDIEQTRHRRTVTIRSAWSVADSNGVHRQGFTEHRIDLDE